MLETPVFASLLVSNEETGGKPTLPEGSRLWLEDALRSLLVDRSALEVYVSELRQYILRCKASGKPQGWPHKDLLPEEVEARVLSEGLQALGDDGLAALALNVVALLDLHEKLLDSWPAAWRPVLALAGAATARRHGIDLDKLLDSAIKEAERRQDG